MQLSLAFLFALSASVVSSQSVSSLVAQLPSCAISCLATAASSVGCGISDYACQCGAKKSALTSSATPCVLKACSNDEALKVNSLTSEICKEATTGTQTSLTNQGSMVSGIYPASSLSTTYTTVPATYTTAAASTYAAGGSSSYAASATSAAGGASSTASSPSSTSSSPATVSGNAATKLQGGVVAVGAVMLAALAM